MKVSPKFVPYFLIVLGSMQKKKSSTRLYLIKEWSKDLTVGWYFGIGLIMITFLILVTV